MGYFDFSSSYSVPGTANRIGTFERRGFPLAVVRAAGRAAGIDVGAAVALTSLGLGGADLTCVDAELGLSRSFATDQQGPAGRVSLAYRWINWKLDSENSGSDVHSNLTFQGPTIGLVLKW